MQKTISHFLFAVLALMLFLLVVSIVWATKGRDELDDVGQSLDIERDKLV